MGIALKLVENALLQVSAAGARREPGFEIEIRKNRVLSSRGP